jgi:hypothetical protein
MSNEEDDDGGRQARLTDVAELVDEEEIFRRLYGATGDEHAVESHVNTVEMTSIRSSEVIWVNSSEVAVVNEPLH